MNDERGENSGRSRDVLISGWPVEHYAHVAKWPAVLTIVLNIIVITARFNTSFIWLFLIALTIFLGVAAARVYRGNIGNATVLGLTAGLIVGVFTSLFQFLWVRTVESFFQIVTISLLSVLVGMLMSASSFLVVAKEHRPSHREKVERERMKGKG